MRFKEYSHRHADAIIRSDIVLNERYEQFIGALRNISDEEIIDDFLTRQEEHSERNTSFKSITPSINKLLKDRIMEIPGWRSEVDIFNIMGPLSRPKSKEFIVNSY